MDQKIKKIEAHANHLLTAFILLRERYALLKPMLYNEEIVKRRGHAKAARGFLILRHSLFLSCSQDIAKLTLDSDSRTPSIKNLLSELSKPVIAAAFKEKFSVWSIPYAEPESDPLIIKAMEAMDRREEVERRIQFQQQLTKLFSLWESFYEEPCLKGFLTIRNKISAHTEVHLNKEEYHFIDIGELGVKWLDLEFCLNSMQAIIELIGLTIRNSSFAWDALDHQLETASNGFWLS